MLKIGIEIANRIYVNKFTDKIGTFVTKYQTDKINEEKI